MEMGVGGGGMERTEKEKVKRGVFLSAAALQNHHMGHVEYSLFSCILRSHTLNAHYTAFMCRRRLPLCEGRVAEDAL